MESKRNTLGCGGFLMWLALFGGLKFSGLVDFPNWFVFMPVWITLAGLVVIAFLGVAAVFLDR